MRCAAWPPLAPSTGTGTAADADLQGSFVSTVPRRDVKRTLTSIPCPQCTGRQAALDGNWHLPLLSAAAVLSVKGQAYLEVNVTVLGESWLNN